MQIARPLCSSRPSSSRAFGTSLLGLQTLARKTAKTSQDLGLRCLKTSFWNGSASPRQPLHVHVSAGQIEAAIARAAANSVGTAEDRPRPNPCSFYLLNLAIDTTIGIPILIVLLRLIHAGASYADRKPTRVDKVWKLRYPPKVTWWLKQSILYFLGLLGMKACVFLIFTLCPWIIVVGNWALRWTEGNEAIQIAFVMLIFPLIMNALQYYIIDSFIKNNKPALEDGNSDREHGEGEEDGLLTPEDGDIVEGIDASVVQKEALVTNKLEGAKTKSYSADKDNEAGTPAGESSSSASHLEADPATRKAT